MHFVLSITDEYSISEGESPSWIWRKTSFYCDNEIQNIFSPDQGQMLSHISKTEELDCILVASTWNKNQIGVYFTWLLRDNRDFCYFVILFFCVGFLLDIVGTWSALHLSLCLSYVVKTQPDNLHFEIGSLWPT